MLIILIKNPFTLLNIKIVTICMSSYKLILTDKEIQQALFKQTSAFANKTFPVQKVIS